MIRHTCRFLRQHLQKVLNAMWAGNVCSTVAARHGETLKRGSCQGDTLPLPSVSEPFLAWTISGEVDFQEREYKRPWLTNRINQGSFFLTSGGAQCWVGLV
jgi:hypothetical protein